jgi:hypothetical protein
MLNLSLWQKTRHLVADKIQQKIKNKIISQISYQVPLFVEYQVIEKIPITSLIHHVNKIEYAIHEHLFNSRHIKYL